ncbi:MAG: CBS domain-containing protein [Gammaproteobacteria bacterium]|nr:CBS domain-containing protein [Gammaproteobacteria bacterium]
MNKQSGQRLQAADFVMAMQEMGTFIDISVDDLLLIHQKAEKYASMRNRESVMVEKLMTHPVKTVQADSPFSDAAHLMVTNKISGLPVVDDENKIVGIITEADFLRALGVPTHQPNHSVWQTLENMFSQPVQVHETEGLVADLMINNVITITPQQSLHQVLDVMKHNRIKRVVVCDETQHVVGMITRSDLVRMFFDHFTPVNHDFKKD